MTHGPLLYNFPPVQVLLQISEHVASHRIYIRHFSEVSSLSNFPGILRCQFHLIPFISSSYSIFICPRLRQFEVCDNQLLSKMPVIQVLNLQRMCVECFSVHAFCLRTNSGLYSIYFTCQSILEGYEILPCLVWTPSSHQNHSGSSSRHRYSFIVHR
jgi:hypothetical protein